VVDTKACVEAVDVDAVEEVVEVEAAEAAPEKSATNATGPVIMPVSVVRNLTAATSVTSWATSPRTALRR